MSNIEKFKFNPPLGFNDSNAYPDPIDEESVREMMQRPHNQTRDYINRLTTLLEEKGASFIVTSDGKTIEQALKEIAEVQGVSDYKDLSNKPSINGVELNGDTSLDELGLTLAIEESTEQALTAAKESGMFDGPQGPIGLQGEKGDAGPQGPQGIQGEKGEKGDKGDKGDTGATGPQGPAGADGKNGTDATVTSANISKALGYTPAKQTDVTQLSEEIADLKNGVVTVPSYWVSELETKANDIQVAMEKAGRNKSSFLWYTDAHWVNGNAKVSPMLLNYLYKNTPINKVNFGGDIIGDSLLATRDEMKYLYEWRNAIRDLPNHHSVFGNHDMFASDNVNYEDDNYRYAFLLAPEESSDMVWGNGNYYYIDNPAEKTRYLYLAYIVGNHTAMTTQGQFICDAIKSVQDGWHIVAIAHRWWQYSSSSTPTTGSIPQYESEILQIFDEYNARGTHTASNYFNAQDFTSGKGKVEFCIAGHIHVDYDIFSNGGIPIIITTADTNQNRVPTSTVDSGTVGTITESAVFGIIADYNEEVTKITVVGVGRGTSRVVRASNVQPTSISDITYSGDTTIESAIDKSKFAFTVNYSDGSTLSVNGANSVTPTTITTVGNNTVTITYVESGVTLSATTTIVGTPKPVVNLLNLDRTYVSGASGENILSYLDDSKAYLNVAYVNGTFNAKSSNVSGITENSVTVTEPGVGGITVAYFVNLPNLATKSYKLSFDYEGVNSKKARCYFRGVYDVDGLMLANNNLVVDSAGSGHIDFEISSTKDFTKAIVFFGSNTSGTATFTNVSLVEL